MGPEDYMTPKKENFDGEGECFIEKTILIDNMSENSIPVPGEMDDSDWKDLKRTRVPHFGSFHKKNTQSLSMVDRDFFFGNFDLDKPV